ncbi:MAG: hypothetical protein WC706_02795 [Sideroxydans sp.]
MRYLSTVGVCLLGLCGSTLAAEQFSDPTRPAFELVPGLSSTTAGADTVSDKVETPPTGLQSVIISPEREAAIINGVEVERGSRYGDAVLTVVNETCIVLMGPQGRQVMHMFPTVSMTKNELSCVKQQGMKPIAKVAHAAGSTNTAGAKNKPKARRKPSAVKKRAVVCAPEEIKDGSKK